MLAIVASVVLGGCSGGLAPRSSGLPSADLGGDGSVASRGDVAFSLPVRGLDEETRSAFLDGEALFRREFSVADGLGPTFIASACSECHVRDGRGSPLDVGAGTLGMIDPGDPMVVEDYGHQIQPRAIPGVSPEALLDLTWIEENEVELSGGESFRLRRPVAAVIEPALSPIANEHVALRTAPALHGSGLLGAVPQRSISEWADPDDLDGDGISGRVPVAVDGDAGSVGWKALQSSIRDQIVVALSEDLGITTPDLPEENCPTPQLACREVQPASLLSGDQVDLLTTYVQALGVPIGRDWDAPAVDTGFDVFVSIGCDRCHRSTMETGTHSIDALSDQTIHSFTDLLVHDMGPGLADPFDTDDVSGSEWRTPPLWGIGLTETVSGHTYFLHDGRARGLTEAILWHGGEAEQSRDAFEQLSREQRRQLLEFLASL